MKRVLLLSFIASLALTPAEAALKPIAVQLGSIFPAPAGAEGFVLSGKNAIFIQNASGTSEDVVVIAQDQGGIQVWQKSIDSGFDEVATAITTDPLGNIWIAGASAAAPQIETPTSLAGIDNPDAVNIDDSTSLRTDMNLLTLWKVSAAGDVAATYTLALKSIPTVNSISATNSGVSIVGATDGKPFLVNLISGTFGKLIPIGTSKTELNVVSRNSDGSSSIFGSSAENLASKKLASIRDGVLIKVSKAGAITSLVRSSAIKASRSWISGDATNLVSGPVITGKVTETAITKFGSTFAPVWTFRIPSTGASSSISANGNSYLALTSRGTISGISGWKPTSPSLLVITFDSKGVIKAATALPGLVTPLSLSYSTARGVSGLATSPDGTVSIFTLVSR